MKSCRIQESKEVGKTFHKLHVLGMSCFLVHHVEERPWWPIQSPNKGGKTKAKS